MNTKMSTNFQILRLLENRLCSSECHLEIELDLNHETPPDIAKNKLKAIRFWLSEFVHGCIAYDVHTEIDTTLLEEVANNIMLCPDEPQDYLLLMLLHSKLCAIGGEEVGIRSTSLITDTGEGFSNTVEGSIGDWLPDIDQWIGEKRFWNLPWWSREDSSTVDLIPEDGDDLDIKPHIGENLLELVSDDPKVEEKSQPAEIIKPTFKPRIIDGQD